MAFRALGLLGFWNYGPDFLGFWAFGLLCFWTSGLSGFWALGKFEDNFTKYWCGAWGYPSYTSNALPFPGYTVKRGREILGIHHECTTIKGGAPLHIHQDEMKDRIKSRVTIISCFPF